jgi:hypothetical protein
MLSLTCSVVAEARERLGVNKQILHGFHRERFNLKNLNSIVITEHYRVQVSNSFVALENLDADVDIKSAWKTIRENIKFQLKRV